MLQCSRARIFKLVERMRLAAKMTASCHL